MSDEKLTHLDEHGAARMVDVSAKAVTRRLARASASVRMRPETLTLITSGESQKGDVLAAARLAGIMAAKRTGELIPLCHPLPLDSVVVELRPSPPDRLLIEATAVVSGRTGVEMEAMTAVSVAALTVYDMCKALSHAIVLGPAKLVGKRGGKRDFGRTG